METVKVSASKSYNVIIGYDTSALLGKKLKELFGEVRVCVVTDDNVAALYLEDLRDRLRSEKIKHECFTVKHGERSKTPAVLFQLLEFLAKNHFTRSDVVIALGGGVTGDLAGLGAALYMRGMHLVQMPTSLLAMVDSSVGGKTAVNLEAGKNLAGVFCQPELVLCDTKMLKTLPRENFCDGMAEIIKYGVIGDRRLFELVRDGGAILNLEKVIARCVEIKRDMVNEDEYDRGKRQLLNFGHTFGHAIEKLSNYQISHGTAVAMGMVLISEFAWDNKYSTERCQDEIIDALLENGLPVSCPYEAKELYYNAVNDKKVSSGNITLIVPERIGKCRRLEISLNEFKELLNK